MCMAIRVAACPCSDTQWHGIPSNPSMVAQFRRMQLLRRKNRYLVVEFQGSLLVCRRSAVCGSSMCPRPIDAPATSWQRSHESHVGHAIQGTGVPDDAGRGKTRSRGRRCPRWPSSRVRGPAGSIQNHTTTTCRSSQRWESTLLPHQGDCWLGLTWLRSP